MMGAKYIEIIKKLIKNETTAGAFLEIDNIIRTKKKNDKANRERFITLNPSSTGNGNCEVEPEKNSNKRVTPLIFNEVSTLWGGNCYPMTAVIEKMSNNRTLSTLTQGFGFKLSLFRNFFLIQIPLIKAKSKTGII